MNNNPHSMNGEPEEPLIPAFKRAMYALDTAVRIQNLKPTDDLPVAYAEVSRLAGELVHQFETIMRDNYTLADRVATMQKDAARDAIRLELLAQQGSRMEELYIDARLEVQTVANNCARLNDEKNEVARFARSLERTLANQSGSIEAFRAQVQLLEESNKQLEEAVRDMANRANAADASNAEKLVTLQQVREERNRAVKLARRRRLVLKDAQQFIHDVTEGQSFSKLVTDNRDELLDKIRDAARMIDYATGDADHSPDNPTTPRREHSFAWNSEEGMNLCLWCGVSEAGAKGGEFCPAVEADGNGINKAAALTTVAEAIQAAE